MIALYKLISFLENNGVNHETKKAMVLSKEHVIKFITKADIEIYLMIKI